MSIHIRRAIPSDADKIAAVLVATFRQFEPLYTRAGFQATTPAPTEIARRFEEGPIWVATDGEAIVGTVSVRRTADEVYIRSMAVVPAARGQGVATQLMTVIHAYAVSEGVRRLTLTTTPFLLDAIHLYERLGFQRTPEHLDLHGTPLIAMMKDLGVVRGRRPTSA